MILNLSFVLLSVTYTMAQSFGCQPNLYCWEECLVTPTDLNPASPQVEEYQRLRNFIYTIKDARYAYGFNRGVAFAMDQTVDSRSEYLYQKFLATIVSFTEPASSQCQNPFFLSAYQDASAYGYNDWQCSDTCTAASILYNLPEDSKVINELFPDALESACGFLNSVKNSPNVPCGGGSTNPLLLAFVNSEGQYVSSGGSFCNNFNERIIIDVCSGGIQTPPGFPTPTDSWDIKMPFNSDALGVTETVKDCMIKECCQMTKNDFYGLSGNFNRRPRLLSVLKANETEVKVAYEMSRFAGDSKHHISL